MRKKWILNIRSNFSELGLLKKKVLKNKNLTPFKKAFYERLLSIVREKVYVYEIYRIQPH